MRSLTKLDDWSRSDVEAVFTLADDYRDGRGPATAGSAVMFFPSTSLRTRVTFERGASLMGLQPIVFPRHHARQAGSIDGRRAVPGGVG
jgi:ornithine carbamoyltransferase